MRTGLWTLLTAGAVVAALGLTLGVLLYRDQRRGVASGPEGSLTLILKNLTLVYQGVAVFILIVILAGLGTMGFAAVQLSANLAERKTETVVRPSPSIGSPSGSVPTSTSLGVTESLTPTGPTGALPIPPSPSETPVLPPPSSSPSPSETPVLPPPSSSPSPSETPTPRPSNTASLARPPISETFGYHLQFPVSGGCIEVPGFSTVNGTQLDQDGCSQPNGQWYFHDVGNGLYEIRNAATGKCINIATNSPADASMVQWDCTPSSTEYFQPIYSGRSDPFTYYLLKNSYTGNCLNVAGGSTKSGAKIIQWTCLPGANNEQIAFTR